MRTFLNKQATYITIELNSNYGFLNATHTSWNNASGTEMVYVNSM